MPTTERVERERLTLTLPYTFLKPLRLLLPSFAAEVVAEADAAAVMLHLQVPADRCADFRQAVEGLTPGQAAMAWRPQASP